MMVPKQRFRYGIYPLPARMADVRRAAQEHGWWLMFLNSQGFRPEELDMLAHHVLAARDRVRKGV